MKCAVSLLCLAAASVLLPTVPRAQSFEFYPYDETNSESLDDVEFSGWINSARCRCDQLGGGVDGASLHLRVVDSSGSYTTDEVYFYLGDDCDNEAVTISEQCYELRVVNHSDFNQEQTIPIPANQVVDPFNGECEEYNSGTSTVFVIMTDTGNIATATYSISYDTKRPGTPASLSAGPGEDAVTVSWDPPDVDDENIEYYDILCAQDGTPVGTASPHWSSPETVCGLTEEGELWSGCDDVDTGLVEGETPNPCYVCGSVSASGTSGRIEGLTVGQQYQFAVVAVDESGNVSYVSEVISATPVPTTDFAEHYAELGGQEEGGYCFVATELYGSYDHPEVRQLRRFRDEVLAKSAAGRAFISWYYRNGRWLARMTRYNVALRVVAWLGVRALAFASGRLLPYCSGTTPPWTELPPSGPLLFTLGYCAKIATPEYENHRWLHTSYATISLLTLTLT